jgi:hypothetical protein
MFRYSNLEMIRAFTPKQRSQTQREKPAGTALVQYQQVISNKICMPISTALENSHTCDQKHSYCGIFAQSKNCGARETAIAR